MMASGVAVGRLLGRLWRSPAVLSEVHVAAGCGVRLSRSFQTHSSLQHLSRHATGVKVWEEAAQSKAREEFDLRAECEKVVENLNDNRYAKSSNLTKIFDHVTTVDELEAAEKALLSFRRSLSRPTPALPLVIVRACLRAESPQRALRYIRNKVAYGVFPSRRVFHVLMDAFIKEGDAAGAVSVYNQMEEDEVVPDGMTFHLASRAHSMLGTLESLEEAELLCRQCRELEPKLGSKSFVVLVKSLLTQEKGEEAVSLLSRLEQDQLLLPQTHLNLMTHALVEIGQLDRAMDVLRNKLCVPSEDGTELGLPQEAWPQLQAAVHSTSDMELRQKLEGLEKDITCRNSSVQ